jgi:hypothetical protein
MLKSQVSPDKQPSESVDPQAIQLPPLGTDHSSSFGKLVQTTNVMNLKKDLFSITACTIVTRLVSSFLVIFAVCFDLYCLYNLTFTALELVLTSMAFSVGCFIVIQPIILCILAVR